MKLTWNKKDETTWVSDNGLFEIKLTHIYEAYISLSEDYVPHIFSLESLDEAKTRCQDYAIELLTTLSKELGVK